MEETAELRAWFAILRQLELVGRHPDRYLGYAYGNLSRRSRNGFIISCTQTSGKKILENTDFSLVTDIDIQANSLRSTGPCKPSSETLTHGVIYQALPAVGAVFHVHSPIIWKQTQKLGLPETYPAIEYGTPQMALAVAELVKRHMRNEGLVFSMGGHEDGIIACANTPEQAGLLLMKVLARANQLPMNPALSS
ncbi:MAG TPA: class II aldolase/adducin family protein [Thiolapillus brandeum]|uniref:Class II aldolase/adducin family protein n=1 Tax=Thiolapillus brandeum TaxID=1076588 RepID=A0A831KDP8_9GAMM|nr:class II aldolase/adducin family protein [Thiolapillus brandeum]